MVSVKEQYVEHQIIWLLKYSILVMVIATRWISGPSEWSFIPCSTVALLLNLKRSSRPTKRSKRVLSSSLTTFRLVHILRISSKNVWLLILKKEWIWRKCFNTIFWHWSLSPSKFQSQPLYVLQPQLLQSNTHYLLDLQWQLLVHHPWEARTYVSRECYITCKLHRWRMF